jgi:hypothetical protein
MQPSLWSEPLQGVSEMRLPADGGEHFALCKSAWLESEVDSPDGSGPPYFGHTAVDAAGDGARRRRALLIPGRGLNFVLWLTPSSRSS